MGRYIENKLTLPEIADIVDRERRRLEMFYDDHPGSSVARLALTVACAAVRHMRCEPRGHPNLRHAKRALELAHASLTRMSNDRYKPRDDALAALSLARDIVLLTSNERRRRSRRRRA